MIIFDYAIFAIPLLTYITTRSITAFSLVLAFCLSFMYSPDMTHSDYLLNFFYSPSDGIVRTITNNDDKLVISLFLNIFDNHTQYIPVKSTFVSQKRISGAFEPAFLEHSVNNEQVETMLKSVDYLFDYKIEQITGVLTRRIKNLLPSSPTQLLPGSRLGFIVLGSRVDITVPVANVRRLLIEPGQHVRAMQQIIELNTKN